MYRSQKMANCTTLRNSCASVSPHGYLPHQKHEEMKDVMGWLQVTFRGGQVSWLPLICTPSKGFFLCFTFLCPVKTNGRVQAEPVHAHTPSFSGNSLKAETVMCKLHVFPTKRSQRVRSGVCGGRGWEGAFGGRASEEDVPLLLRD